MKKTHAIFFDIDGTIFEPGTSDVSFPVRKAISDVQSLGHFCFVASGRPYTTLPEFITSLGFDGYICGNGTQIVMNKTMIQQHTLNPESSHQIIQCFEELNLQYIILTTDQNCVSTNHDELFDYYKQYNLDLDAMKTSYDLSHELSHALKIETMTHTLSERNQIRSLAESLGFFVEIKKDGYLELSDRTITKGTAILEIMKHLNLPLDQSICFGDGLNDLDMFHTAAYSIAMGNAVEELKQIADEITKPVSEDGVAFSLSNLFL